MILREITRGPTSVILEIRPYRSDLQPPNITPAQIDALPPYMVLVRVGAAVVSRQGFNGFDDADGRDLNPSSFRGEAFARLSVTPQRMPNAFLAGDQDTLVKRRGPRGRRAQIEIENARGRVGEVLLLDVTMDHAPNGVAGYTMTATLRDPRVAQITDVFFPGGFLLASHTPDPVSGPAVRFSAVDLGGSVQAGARDATLARVQLELLAVGRTDLELVVNRLDDDNGDSVPSTFINADLRVFP